MTKFTSISYVNIYMLTLFIFFLTLANNHQISANRVYQRNDDFSQLAMLSEDDDQSKGLFERDTEPYNSMEEDALPMNLWSRLFRPSYAPRTPSVDFKRGLFRIFPYKKRTIPLELQKALYAHGIVGRRR